MSRNKIRISEFQSHIDFDWLICTIQASYWGAYLKREQIVTAASNSLCFGAYIDDMKKQIGFVRVVTDKAIFSSVTEMIVDEKFRSLGCGSALMESVISHPYIAPTICILETRDAARFYAKFGFETMAGGVMKRNPS